MNVSVISAETVIDGIMKLQDRIARSKHVILTKDF